MRHPPRRTVSSCHGLQLLVADRMALFRRGVGELLRQAVPGLEVDESASLAEAIKHMADWPANVLVVDLDAEGEGAAAQLFLVRTEYPAAKVIVLSSAGDRESALA